MKSIKHIILGLVFTASATTAEANKGLTIPEIETYLNSLTTWQADFSQFNSGQPMMTGTFYIERPRKFLWQYKTPVMQKLVSTGSKLYFHNEENEQTTQIPLNQGLPAFLTRKEFSFAADDIIVKNFSSHMDVTAIEVTTEEGERNGQSIVFKFQNEPVQLIQLVTKDGMGGDLYVNFYDQQQGHDLNDSLFKFKAPFEF